MCGSEVFCHLANFQTSIRFNSNGDPKWCNLNLPTRGYELSLLIAFVHLHLLFSLSFSLTYTHTHTYTLFLSQFHLLDENQM